MKKLLLILCLVAGTGCSVSRTSKTDNVQTTVSFRLEPEAASVAVELIQHHQRHRR